MELEESIKLAVEGCDAKLYDIVSTKEHGTNILRVFVTQKGGVNLEKCTQISRMISPILDIHEPFSGEYNLEVSSPGIERKIKTLAHFQCSIDENVKVKNYATETIRGKLTEVTDDGVITIKDEEGNESTINFDDVLSASTYFKWK